MNEDGTKFRYPSYVEDIMGPMCFDFGFGRSDGFAHLENIAPGKV